MVMTPRGSSRLSKRVPKVRSFPPIVSDRCRVLVLGTMPGGMSLQKRQYYGNPRNAFWEFIFKLAGEHAGDDYSLKKKLLIRNRIALWDVLKRCERRGSLDSAIRCEKPNAFRAFFKRYPRIRTVFFNGNPASRFYKKHVGFHDDVRYFVLPSTSPAHTQNRKDKWKVWAQLRRAVRRA